VQVLEIALKICSVVHPPQSIHARRGILFEFEERLFEKIDADVVEERGEFFFIFGRGKWVEIAIHGSAVL